jgi:hypothetical protein
LAIQSREQPELENALRKIDQALASAAADPSPGASEAKCGACGSVAHKTGSVVCNSPGASERRTTARCALENSALWALLSQRPSPCGQASVIAAEYGDWHIRVCNAIRDVNAAGDEK